MVHQEKAALKVSTDSCLFGAWVANELNSRKYDVRTVLDIGAGTGLLMLMLAQQCKAGIDGIEIDEPSYLQAKENILLSPWKERLHLFHNDVKQFQVDKKYDFIVSNPPFYEGDLKSNAASRNVAMHDEGLTLDELLMAVDKNLSDDGRFAVLLPYSRSEEFITNAGNAGFCVSKRLDVKQSVNHSYFRSVLLFDRKETVAEKTEIAIKEADNEYTATFVNLLKEYYLRL